MREVCLPLGSTLVLAALAAAGCSAEEEGAAKPGAAPAPPPPTVVAERVRVEDVPITLEFVARTEAVETVRIEARVEALLESTHFEEGGHVEEGQVLYELDRRTYVANLQSAQANLARAEADLKLAEEQVSVRSAEAALSQAQAELEKAHQDVARLRPLAEKDAVPRQDLDTAIAAEKVATSQVDAQEANLTNSKIMEEVGVMQAQAEVKRAKASVDLAELDLSYCTIESPIAGLIGRTEVSAGNLVGRGAATELATVSSIDPIYVTMAISEEEFLKAQTQQPERERDDKFELILADDSVYPHRGHLVTVDRAVALETGTLQLVTEFPNPDGTLRPGQFGRLRVVVTTVKGGIVVPQRAIMEQQGTKVVLVVKDDDTVELRTVQVAERYEDDFLVTDGLSGNERVIVEGQIKARPGQKVQPTDRPASSEPRKD